MNRDKPLSEQIREQLDRLSREAPDRDLAGLKSPDVPPELNPDTDKEAFSSTRRNYEDQLLGIDQTYITDSILTGSSEMIDLLKALNESANPAAFVTSGLRGRLKHILKKLFTFALSEEIERQSKLTSLNIQVHNIFQQIIRDVARQQREFNARLPLFFQSIVPMVDEKIRFAYETLNKLLMENVVLLTTRMDVLHRGLDRRLAEVLSYQKDAVEWLQNTSRDLDATLRSFKKLEIETRQGLVLQHKKLDRLLSDSRQSKPQNSHDSAGSESGYAYVLFENIHRGAEDHIRQDQERYVPLFKTLAPVLDIGCGRGEFLELLKAEGISASGIDANDDMTGICRQKNLDVETSDANAFLRSSEPESLGGVFAAQIVEHMPTTYLADFLSECHRVLRTNGILVIETINTGSIYALSQHYFRDPTHQLPRHPETYRFMVEMAGFQDVKIEYIHPPSGISPIPKPESPIQGESPSEHYLEALQDHLKALHMILYAGCDIVLTAKK